MPWPVVVALAAALVVALVAPASLLLAVLGLAEFSLTCCSISSLFRCLAVY